MEKLDDVTGSPKAARHGFRLFLFLYIKFERLLQGANTDGR